jgi:hypothetical protein
MPRERIGLIVFDDGVGMYTQSTVEQISDAIATVTSSRIPLIKVLDQDGAEIWINADHIRAFQRGLDVQLEERPDAAHAIEGVTTTRAGRLPFRLARRDPDR